MSSHSQPTLNCRFHAPVGECNQLKHRPVLSERFKQHLLVTEKKVFFYRHDACPCLHSVSLNLALDFASHILYQPNRYATLESRPFCSNAVTTSCDTSVLYRLWIRLWRSLTPNYWTTEETLLLKVAAQLMPKRLEEDVMKMTIDRYNNIILPML